MIHRFGEFTLDERLGELRRSGEVVPLQPKVLDLLVYLVRNRDRPVSKEELFAELWSDVVVSDAALTSAVRDARVAIGDRDRSRWAIRTLPRRGYRFVADVVTSGGEPEAAAVPGADAPVFVGRDAVLARLDAALDAALDGNGRIALLAGEPGIGKTRCAEVFADRARRRGVGVHQAWCHEPDGAPPYWPWTQILRAVLGLSAEEHARIPRALARELCVLLPELPATARTPALEADPGQVRLRLFEAVGACLEQAAGRRPLLLCLDDLHAADRSSLRLLQFVGRRIRRARILLVASLRDREPTCSPLLTEVLSELLRAVPVERSDLSGLGTRAVEEWIRRRGDEGDAATLAETLVRLTAGNPLFIEQLLYSRGTPESPGWLPGLGLPAPASLRDVVRWRVQRLSDACQRTIAAASALGRDLEPELLCEVVGLDRPHIDRALEEATDAYLLRADGDAGVRFANPLIQEVVYADQPASQKERWHRRAVSMLGSAAGSEAADPSVLARHALATRSGDDAARLARHAARAGHRALELRAYDEAEAYFDHALAILGRDREASPRERCELLLARGEAQSAGGFYHESGRASFLRAAQVARFHGWPELLARAALGVGGLSHEIAMEDQTLIELLEESLERLGADGGVLAARVTARLAVELQRRPSATRGRRMAERAVALSRQLADDAALGQALVARLLHLWVPEELSERRRIAREIARIGRARGDPALELWGRNALLACLLEKGPRAEWQSAFERYTRLARKKRIHPHLEMTDVVEILAALVDGRLAEAERSIGRVLTAPPTAASPLSAMNAGIQRQWLRLLRGDPIPESEVEALSSPSIPGEYATTARCIASFLYAERGDARQAGRLLADLAADDFEGLPRNMFWLLSLVLLSRVCLRLGDQERAARLETRLRPFASHRVGLSFHYFGSVGRHLGALAGARSAWDDAVSHLEQAVVSEESLRARPFAALAHAELGRALLERARAGDRDRGLRELRVARKEAVAVGMRGLANELGALLRPARLPRGASPGAAGS